MSLVLAAIAGGEVLRSDPSGSGAPAGLGSLGSARIGVWGIEPTAPRNNLE